MSDSLRPHGLQHARLPCPSPSPGVFENSCALSRWCHPTISSSVLAFFSCLQSFLASGSFLMSRFFASGGQSIGASASTSVLPLNIQDWFPLGLTGLISLLSEGLSRVFSSTTVQKHHFFSIQPSLWSNFHIHNWLLEEPSLGVVISDEHSGLISFRMDWFDPLAVRGTLKSLLQHHSLKASFLWCSAFFMVQLSHHTLLQIWLWGSQQTM